MRFVTAPRPRHTYMVIDVVTTAPKPRRTVTPLLNGGGHIAMFGYEQTRTVEYAWANETEKDDIISDSVFGCDVLFPAEEGWVYDQPDVREVLPTLHLFTISVHGQRYLRNNK